MVAPEGVDLRLSVAVGADQALDGVRQLLVEGVARVEGCLLHKVVIKTVFFPSLPTRLVNKLERLLVIGSYLLSYLLFSSQAGA